MRKFNTEDFAGCGQYIIRNDFKPNAGVRACDILLKKIGYCIGWGTTHEGDGNVYTITDMCDGMTSLGYFDKSKPKGEESWVMFDSLQKLCDYLNDEVNSQEFRFATQEEVVRVVLYQKARWRN